MINKDLKIETESIPIGTVVWAKAGREKGGFFLVVGGVSDKDRTYALISDGKTRKIEKPKKKNIKHLSKTKTVVTLYGLTNKQVRIILSKFIEECASV